MCDKFNPNKLEIVLYTQLWASACKGFGTQFKDRPPSSIEHEICQINASTHLVT